MKKYLFLLALLFTINITYSQIRFTPGYFISNNGDSTQCLIRNVGWKNNPTEFKYKMTEEAEIMTGTIQEVKEFNITSGPRYKRFDVSLDTASNQLDLLSNNSVPEYKNEQLFLKVLVQGDANLYEYEKSDQNWYFYNKGQEPVKPLIYKEYKEIGSSFVMKNEAFKYELKTMLPCPDKISADQIQSLEYDSRALTKLFNTYNKCVNPSFVNTQSASQGKNFHLRINAGVAYSSLHTFKEIWGTSDYESKAGLRLGLESEFTLGFNNNKWAILLESSFQNYNSTARYNNKIENAKLNLLMLGIGLRHYFFFENQAGLFVNGLYKANFPINSSIIDRAGDIYLQA